MEQLYDIYFAGKLVDDSDIATVRGNLGELFKIKDGATLDKLFSGKPQAIKRGVDKPAAIKYKTAMARAGAVALVKAHTPVATKPAAAVPGVDDEELPSSSAIKPANEPAAAQSMADRIAALAGDPAAPSAADMTLAPTGAEILSEDERKVVETANIDTSNIQLAPSSADPEPVVDTAPPAPDTSHLSMGEVGEDIPHLELDIELLNPDVSHLTMGEAGEDIPHLEVERELLDPDTSAMSLAPEGSDVLEEEYRRHEQAQAPSTDHLSLEPPPG
jgi:hypothetical protein